jgi:RNA polymerase sigma-70 factor (ECF subfamily)
LRQIIPRRLIARKGVCMISPARNEGETPLPRSPAAAVQFRQDFVALIPHLRAFSRLLCGNRPIAEDLVQEALSQAWRARDRFEPGSSLKAWLFTILRNKFYSHLRRAKWETECNKSLSEIIPAPAHEQERAMELSDIPRALCALPASQREAVILVAAGGYTYEDAARLCRTSAQNVKSRVSRGRARLLQLVDGERSLPPRPAARATEAVETIVRQLNALSTVVPNDIPQA